VKIDGARLKAAREQAPGRPTQTEAAVIAGVTEQTLARWEKKGGTVNLHIARALAKAYNVAVKSFEVQEVQK